MEMTEEQAGDMNAVIRRVRGPGSASTERRHQLEERLGFVGPESEEGSEPLHRLEQRLAFVGPASAGAEAWYERWLELGQRLGHVGSGPGGSEWWLALGKEVGYVAPQLAPQGQETETTNEGGNE